MSFPGPWIQPDNMRVGKFYYALGSGATTHRQYGGLIDADGTSHMDAAAFTNLDTGSTTVGMQGSVSGLASAGSPIDFDKADRARESAEAHALLYPDQVLGTTSFNVESAGPSAIVKYGSLGGEWDAQYTTSFALTGVPATVDSTDAAQGLPAGDDPIWDDPNVVGYEFHPDDQVTTVDVDATPDVFGSWVTWFHNLTRTEARRVAGGSPHGTEYIATFDPVDIVLPSNGPTDTLIAKVGDPAFGPLPRFNYFSPALPGLNISGDRVPPSTPVTTLGGSDWGMDSFPISLTTDQRFTYSTKFGNGAPTVLPVGFRTKALSIWQGQEGNRIQSMDTYHMVIDYYYRPWRYRLLYNTPPTTPYQRMFPREDAFGTGPSRIIPRPRSSQGSPRIIGGYR